MVPVSPATQREVLRLAGENQHARAVARLRREVRLPLVRARELLHRMGEHPQPRDHREAIRLLHEHDPEFGAELRRITREGSDVQAIRRLRERFPMDLGTAYRLVAEERSS